jgi:hypothetical protein
MMSLRCASGRSGRVRVSILRLSMRMMMTTRMRGGVKFRERVGLVRRWRSMLLRARSAGECPRSGGVCMRWSRWPSRGSQSATWRLRRERRWKGGCLKLVRRRNASWVVVVCDLEEGGVFVSMFCLRVMLGQPSACCVLRGVVMGVEAVCRSLRHIIVAIRCRWRRNSGLRRRYDTCIDNGYESRGGAGRDKMC